MLYIHPDGQPPYKLGYDSAGDFYPLSFDARLGPNEAEDGSYSLTWFQGGAAIPATRIADAADDAVGEGAAAGGGAASAPSPAISAEALQAYAGKYRLAPGFIITVRVRGGALEAQATGQAAFPLQTSATADRFLAPGIGVDIRFQRDAVSGEVSSLILHQAGQVLPAPKE